MKKPETRRGKLTPVRDFSPRENKNPRITTQPQDSLGKCPRFTPCHEMHVFHNEVGRVLDISMDGVSFTYIAGLHQPENFPATGMLFTHGGKHIQGIPFEVISDHVHGPFFSSDYFIRERQIRFGDLSVALIGQMECFILENAHIPQLSYDARYLAYKSVYTAAGAADRGGKTRERVAGDNTAPRLARYGGFPQG